MPITINLPNIPNLPISPLAVIHFAFTSLVLLIIWLPQYMFVHVGLVVLLIWAAYDKQSAFAVIIYMVCLLVSFMVDIISIAYYFNFSSGSNISNKSLWQFSAAMALMHLLAKPVMGIYAFVIVLARRSSLKVPGMNNEYIQIDEDSRQEAGGEQQN